MNELGFDAEKAKSYETAVRQMIPGYDLLHHLAETILAADLGAEASLLIVGAGTGKEIVEWGAAHVGWQFTGVDPSQPMTDLAREKIQQAGLKPRVTLHTKTVEQLEPEPRFDAAALMLVLHFIADDDSKANLLSAIFDRLKPGALLVLSSRFGDPQSTRFKKMLALSKAWTLTQGMEAKEADTRFASTRTDLHDVPEERIKTLLRNAGFIDVQRFYQGLLIGAWIARKPR